jgi:hypothetical protein
MKGNFVKNSIPSDPTAVKQNCRSRASETLRFGKIVRSPIVAWGFDTATAKLTPIPFATGGYGRFVENEPNSTWQFVQALPGTYQVSYLVEPKHWKAFSDRAQELRQSAGALFLGVEHAGDDATDAEGCGMSWLDLALRYESECEPEQ